MSKKISIIIPVYNSANLLARTIESVQKQKVDFDFELIVYDDCSTDDSFEVAQNYSGVKVYRNEKNFGPAETRNNAIRKAEGGILAFIDADCVAGDSWLHNIEKHFQDKQLTVLMGNVKIPPSTFLGDSISALGFPGGGSTGFEKIWKVDAEGYTKHITSCNFAVRKEVFEKHGFFDESFPLAGGEDPELALRWSKKGVLIKFCSDVVVFHEPRKSFVSFTKWMFYRGRASFYFKKKVGKIGSFIKLRFWSSKNIILTHLFSLNIFLIIPLLFWALVMQQLGFIYESRKEKK